jgi:tetratricopeptide (TPR) repeat protein
MRAHNPYIIGVPITSTEAFYGREDVFRFVRETLTPRPNVAVLFGQRRIGKTSILHQLPDHLADEFHSVFFDSQDWAGHGVDKVLYDLAATIAKSLKIISPPAARFKDGKYFLEDFLPSVYPQLGRKRLLLLLDEFDTLSEEITQAKGAASTELFPILQNLVADKAHLAFVFVVGRPIEELPVRFQAIFRQGQYKHVSFLGREDATRLIIRPVKDQLHYDAAAIEAILNLTAQHPFFIQVLCFEIFNRLQREKRKQVEIDDVNAIISQALKTGTGSLVWFWNGVPPAERFILSIVAHITTTKGATANEEEIQKSLDQYGVRQFGIEWIEAPDRLADWEVLRQDQLGNYTITIDLVRRWVAKEHPPKKAKREIDGISEIAVQQYEKASRFQTKGDLEAAIEHYRTALQSNPNHLRARIGLAQILHQQGEFVQAIDEYEKAFRLDPNRAKGGLAEARLALAESLEREDVLEEAIAHYQRVLELSPEDKRVREKLKALTKIVEGIAVPPKREEKAQRQLFFPIAAASAGVLILALAAFFAAKGLFPVPTPTKTVEIVSPTATPSPMITLSPQPPVTNTPTVMSTTAIPAVVTATEIPTATNTPMPPTPPPTQTPTATDTPVPPTTIPTQIPTTTPALAQTPTSAPTPPMLQAPQLIWPENGHKFIQGEAALIELQWTWIRPLAEDEWFTLGLRYWRQGERVYTGEGKLKEKKWRVPSHLFGQADQPERAYEWDAAVIKVIVDHDGNEHATIISHTSEPWTFYWP